MAASIHQQLAALQYKQCGYIAGKLCMRGNAQCPYVANATALIGQRQTLTCPYARPGPNDRPVIHASDIHSFLSCRIQWNFQSPLRHNLAPKEMNKHLWFGKVAHFALAAYYSSSTDMTKRSGLVDAYRAEALRTLRAIKEEVGYLPENLKRMAMDGARILEHYEVWCKRHDNFDVVMPEVPLQASFGTFDVAGTSDGVIRDADGRHWLLEHKTYSRMPTHAMLWRSWQSRLYMLMSQSDPELSRLGIHGILYNILYKVPPTLPKLTKSGRLEMRSNLNCSPEMYRHVLDQYREQAQSDEQLDPEQFAPELYRNYLLELHDRKRDYFFKRVEVTYTPKALAQFERHLGELVAEMTNDPPIYPPNAMRACPGCEFETLCDLWMAELPWEESIDGLGYTDNTYYFESD